MPLSAPHAALVVLAAAIGTSTFALPSAAGAQPSGPHPRVFLNAEVKSAWQAAAGIASSPVGRSIARCTLAHDDPSEYSSGQYQGFAWVEALGACLVAHQATDLDVHRDTAITYLMALLNDRDEVGDGLGPSYPGGQGIVSQDTGYSMRTHGVFAALGYDWLHDALSAGQRTTAHDRFVQWLAFHDGNDTYQRAQPGANYHAGHVLAVTLITIAHADEMNTITPGSGTARWNYLVDTMWGDVMAGGHEARGPLLGGDWLEGWQYGPLSVASYSLAGRAMLEQGIDVPWLGTWNAEVLERYVHGLAPDGRWFVGGDSDDDGPLLAPNPLPLYGVIAGHVAESVRAEARGELARLALTPPGDFATFHEALAFAAPGGATPIDRTTLPTSYLAAGAGNYYARTRHDASAAWLVSQCRGIVVDHQHVNAGNLVISRGSDALLVDPGPYGSLSTLTGNAPTMLQPHFNAEYQPSQGAFGESWSGEPVPLAASTRFVFARSTMSGVHATRCDYTGQFRFRDEPSAIVSSAIRDIVALPGDEGMTTLVIDRVRTTPAHGSDPNPLELRFRSQFPWATSGSSATLATTESGGSKLVVRRVIGTATTSTYAVPDASCTGDRGKCRAGRFPSHEWTVSVAGPNPYVVHALDADAASASPPPVITTNDAAVRVVDVHRETRHFAVVSSADGSPVSSYTTSDEPRTHVVVDPPNGANVLVTSTPVAGGCLVTLAPSSAGFASNPLVFTLDATCQPTEDSTEPPRVPPPAPGPDASPSGASGTGCSCEVGRQRASAPDSMLLAVFLVGFAAFVRGRRRCARRRRTLGPTGHLRIS